MKFRSEMPRCWCRLTAVLSVEIAGEDGEGVIHEVMCRRCAQAWIDAPERKLIEQLVTLGKKAEAISQFRSFQAVLPRRVA